MTTEAPKKAPGWLTPARLAMLWAGALVFVTAGYFQNSRPGWNANSQFNLTLAIVERGTLSIDAYHNNPAHPELSTNDKALYNGHYYCDKSPVTAFLGVPVYWAYSAVTRGALGRAVDYNAARYWVTWWVEGLAAALVAAMTAALLMRRGAAPERALCAGALWVAATPLMAYSILFFSYLPACAMALGGYLLVEPLWRGELGAEGAEGWRALAGGFLFGLAAWTLNTMALVALVVTAGVALAPGSAGVRLRRLALWGLGGALGIAGNFIYTRAVFGSWGSPYQYEAEPFFREQMARGLMGATRPRALVAWLITLHPFQGLFLLFPLAAAALGGCAALLAKGRRAGRIEGALTLAATAGLVLYNSAYFMWWGGCGYAPRHLIPTLVLLAAGLAPWLTEQRRWVGRALLAIGAVGALMNLAPVAVNPQHPINFVDTSGNVVEDPGSLLLTPERVGRWPSPWTELQGVFWKMKYADANWGGKLAHAVGMRAPNEGGRSEETVERPRMSGPASTLPLILIWGLALWLALRDPAMWRTQEQGEAG